MLTLVCVVGVVMGLIHRHRAEKPLTIMVISLSALLLVSLAEYAVEPVVYGLFGSARGGGAIVSSLLTLWHAVAVLIHAAATAGLIFAILCDRGIDGLNLSRSNPSSAPNPPSHDP